MTLAELRTYVRDLTGVYSTDLLPDTLLNRWLQESYSELNRAQDWPWLLNEETGSIAIGATVVALTSSAGRVREFAIKNSDNVVYQIPSRKGLIQTIEGDDGHFYDTNASGNIVLSKPFENVVTFTVSYLEAAPLLETSGTATSIPTEYEGMLAYRTAVKVLKSQGDDSDRADYYLQEYASMLEDLRTSVIIDDDLGPFQIGGEILRIDGRTLGRVNLRYRSS